MNNKSICIIPAKANSSRLPGKNIVKLCGKPMLAYTIEAALKSKLFDQVIVSTENNRIAGIAKKYGAQIPCKRPLELTKDTAGVVDVCLHMVDYLEKKKNHYKTLCVLLPTSPLRKAEDIKKAYKVFTAKKANFVMGITKYFYEPFEALVEDKKGHMSPYWGSKYASMKRQHRPQLFVDNGAIYFVNIKAFKKEKTFYGSDLRGYYMLPERSIDVNTPFDLKTSEYLIKRAKQ